MAEYDKQEEKRGVDIRNKEGPREAAIYPHPAEMDIVY